MARINLLPWREERRVERERRFYLLLGASTVAAFAILFFMHNAVENRIAFQEERNQFISQHIASVDQEIATIKQLEEKKAQMLRRMNVIQRLQASRPEVVHLFDELVKSLPEGTQLIKVERKGRTLEIDGVADSNALISAFMRNLDRSAWLKEPSLIVIDSSKKEYPQGSWFSLRVSQQ